MFLYVSFGMFTQHAHSIRMHTVGPPASVQLKHLQIRSPEEHSELIDDDNFGGCGWPCGSLGFWWGTASTMVGEWRGVVPLSNDGVDTKEDTKGTPTSNLYQPMSSGVSILKHEHRTLAFWRLQDFVEDSSRCVLKWRLMIFYSGEILL